MLNREQLSANRVKSSRKETKKEMALSSEEKVEYYTLESSSLFKSKKYSEAIDLLDKAIELNPNHLSALFFKKGIALYQMRDFGEANVYFSKVIQSDPNHTQALFNKGKAFYKLKLYQDADELFNQTLKCEANFSKLFYYKGKINLKNNKFNDAIEFFDKSLDASEHVEESYFNKAIILSKLRKFTESQESFDKAFKLNPNLKNSMEYRDFLYHLNELEKKENIDTNKDLIEKEKPQMKIDTQMLNLTKYEANSSNLNKLKEILGSLDARFIHFDHFMEKSEFYRNVITSNQSIFNNVKEKITNSTLNKKLLARINLNTTKLLETNKLIVTRMKQIQKLKETTTGSLKEVTTQAYSEIFSSINCETKEEKIITSSTESELDQMSTKTFTEVLLVPVSQYFTNVNSIKHNVFDMKFDAEKRASSVEISKFFECVTELLNQNKLEFVSDLAYLAADFIILARAIFGSQHQSLEENSKYFQFSCDPIETEQKIDEFNSNIVSIRLNEYLKHAKYLELKEMTRCTKCTASVSIFTLIDRTSKWKCNFCHEINTEPFKKIHNTNVVYKKTIDLNAKKTSNRNAKIVVFCIDISKSMNLNEGDIDNDFKIDNRLYIAKEASIQMLKSIRDQNPDYKVVLISFSSEAIYYGHGNKYDKLVKDITLDGIDNTDAIEPIQKTYSSLKIIIKELKVNSKDTDSTHMKTMLLKSVRLAASVENSDVVIFSDGKPQDDSDIDVVSLVDYCKLNGSIQINFLTFKNVKIDDFLINLCNWTNGKLIQVEHSKEFANLFKLFIRKPNSENLKKTEKFKLKIQCGTKVLIDKLMLTEEEILIDLNISKETFAKNQFYAYFQFEFDMSDSIRVYTTKLKLNLARNSTYNREILYAFALRKIAELAKGNDSSKILNFWTMFSKLSDKIGGFNFEAIKSINKLVEKIGKMRNKSANMFIKELDCHSKICSFDLNESKRIKHQTEYPTELFQLYCLNEEDYNDVVSFGTNELKSFNDFKCDLNDIFDTFNLNELVDYNQEKSSIIKRLIIGVELIKYSSFIIKMIMNVFQTDQHSKLEADEFNFDRFSSCTTFDEFFHEIIFMFSDFEFFLSSLKTISTGSLDWNTQKLSCLDSLFKYFNVFISSSSQISSELNPDRMIFLLNQISFNLIEQIRNTSFEAEHFNREIKKEVRMKRVTKILHEIKQVEHLDICFLVDCTGSMAVYIEKCKTVIINAVDELKSIFRNLKMRASFIGYYDMEKGKLDDRKIKTFEFSEDFVKFKDFISKEVTVDGGGSVCEDVHGGLAAVNRLDWSNPSRILIHIADAPCHGTQFHDLNASDDEFPEGDPTGLKITKLLRNIVDKRIHYYFTRIANCTNKMIEEFNKELIKLESKKEIQVFDLEKSENLIQVVIKSIRRTIHTNRKVTLQIKTSSVIKNTEINIKHLNWTELSLMNLQKVDYYVPKFFNEYLEIKYRSIEFEKKNNCDLWLAKLPFAKGSQKLIYTGKLSDGKFLILKELLFLDPEFSTFYNYKEVIEHNMIASILFESFYKTIGSKRLSVSVRFIKMDLVYALKSGLFYLSEEYISNAVFLNEYEVIEEKLNEILNAFWHWSYLATNKCLLISGCKVISDKANFYLSHPIVSFSNDFDRFFSTNLGNEGVKMFFESHTCNSCCELLKLELEK